MRRALFICRKFASINQTALAIGFLIGMIFLTTSNRADARIDEDEKANSKPATLSISVIDKENKPVPSAKVELRLWTGDWIETKFNGESNQKGHIEFDGVTTDRYSTILVTHSKFASSMQDFTISAGEDRVILCKLLPPVQSSIEIRSPDGELVVGAEITRLELTSIESDSKTFLTCDMFPILTGKPKSEFRSDESGRLKLPPFPAGSSAKITVVHPSWSSAETSDIQITAGQLTTLMLKQGTHVTMNFHGTKDALAELRDQEVTIHTFTNDFSAETKDARLMHKFVSANDSLKFCLRPGQYDAFYLRAGDLLITPQFGSSPTVSTFNDFSTDNVEKNCVVRKMREIRGRVVTSSGEPVAGATLIVRAENLQANSKGEFVPIKKFGWSPCDYPETDEQGYYTAKVPNGKVSIDSQWSKYYSDPATLEFLSDGVKPAPDFVVYPFPTLKGAVVDDQDNPVGSAVVRIMSTGDYAVTDKDGKFSIQIERFEYDLETEKRKFESRLIAFDPKSDLATTETIGVKDPPEFENVKIKLRPRNPDWLTNQIAKRYEQKMATYTDERKAVVKKYLTENRKSFVNGIPGTRAPELSAGTWLNTDAKSLEDFKGKFVLLDFWFIGCGPCERDIPDLKLAQELFGDQGFTVLSIHTAGQSPENVKQFADARAMPYPLSIDSASEEIMTEYKKAGVRGFPSYLLIGPDGKIIKNDGVSREGDAIGISLRTDKLEAIYQAIQSQKSKSR